MVKTTFYYLNMAALKLHNHHNFAKLTSATS